MSLVAEESRFEDFEGLVSALYKEIQRVKTEQASRLGLRASDVMALYHLGRADTPLTSAELARRSGVDRAAMSRCVARMVEGGFVTVDEGAYRAPVALTELGTSTFVEAETVILQVVDQAGALLSNVDRAVMYRSLNVVLAGLRAL